MGDMRKYKIVTEAFYRFAPELRPTVDQMPAGNGGKAKGMPGGRYVRIAFGEHAFAIFWIEQNQWKALVSVQGDPELFGSAGPRAAIPPMRWAFEVAIGMLEQCMSVDPIGALMSAAKLRDALNA